MSPDTCSNADRLRARQMAEMVLDGMLRIDVIPRALKPPDQAAINAAAASLRTLRDTLTANLGDGGWPNPQYMAESVIDGLLSKMRHEGEHRSECGR